MDARSAKALTNLGIMAAVAVLMAVCFALGRVTGPPHKVEMISTPVADAVTIAPPADGDGLAVFVDGSKVGVWKAGSGAVYERLKFIYEHPKEPELWAGR